MAVFRSFRGLLAIRLALALQIALVVVGMPGLAVPYFPAVATAAPDKKSDDKKAEEEQAQTDASKSKVQMAAMRKIAAGLTVTIADDARQNLDMIPDALFRTYDPAREHADGTIWGYGKTGRPAALLTLALHPRGDGTLGWLYELNSLTNRSVSATVPGIYPWSTRKSGLETRNIPDAPEAADKEVGRTRQLRDLSARFTGYEMLSKGVNGPLERFELRLIPRPIHRYKDPEHGLVDGAIFLFTHSTNPEIILVLEAVRGGDEKLVWKSGFARCAFAEVHVELDGKNVWTQPHLQGTGASEPYWLFFKPIPGGQLDEE